MSIKMQGLKNATWYNQQRRITNTQKIDITGHGDRLDLTHEEEAGVQNDTMFLVNNWTDSVCDSDRESQQGKRLGSRSPRQVGIQQNTSVGHLKQGHEAISDTKAQISTETR